MANFVPIAVHPAATVLKVSPLNGESIGIRTSGIDASPVATRVPNCSPRSSVRFGSPNSATNLEGDPQAGEQT